MPENNKTIQYWINALIIPWHFSVITLTFIISCLAWLIMSLPLIFALFMITPLIAFGGYYLKNGYLLLDHIAAQKTDIPVVGYDLSSMFRDWRHIGQFVITAIIIHVGHIMNEHIYDGLGNFYWLLSVLVLPASIAAMSQENKVFSALNPIRIVEFIKYWGNKYPIILIGVFLQVSIVWFLWKFSDLLFIKILVSLSMFNSLLIWIGYNLQNLEYARVESTQPEQTFNNHYPEFSMTDRKVRWAIDEIYRSSNISNLNGATLAVNKLINDYGESDSIFIALIQETYAWKQKKIHQFIVERYCLFLIKQNKIKQAWSIFTKSQEKLGQYAPNNKLLLQQFSSIAYNFKAFDDLLVFVDAFIQEESYSKELTKWLIKLLELGSEKQEKEKCLNIYKKYCDTQDHIDVEVVNLIEDYFLSK